MITDDDDPSLTGCEGVTTREGYEVPSVTVRGASRDFEEARERVLSPGSDGWMIDLPQRMGYGYTIGSYPIDFI